MLKNHIATICLLIVSLFVNAQTLTRSISWHNNQQKEIKSKSANEAYTKIPIFSFDDAIYPDPETLLPYYFELIPLPANIKSTEQVDVAVRKQVFKPVDNESDINIDLVKKQKETFHSVNISRKISYLQLTIPAVRVNPLTGRAELLESFEVKIEERQIAKTSQNQKAVASQSVLATGKWVKVKVSKTGIHRINYSEIQSMGLANPENISVWGHGGRQLPYYNSQNSPDDLVQIPTWLEKGNDGTFGSGDYMLFYAEGPVTWNYNQETEMFSHKLHDYSSDTYYFITTSISNPLRINTISNNNLNSNYSSSAFDGLVYFERNDTNLIKSGRQWFGEAFDVYSTRTYSTPFSKPVNGGTAKITVRVAARSSVASSFTVKANDNLLGSISLFSVSVSNDYADFVSQREQTFTYPYSQGDLGISLTYNKPTAAAKSWLDYITVMARQQLRYDGDQLLFRDTRSAALARISEFSVENAAAGMMVWDVTNLFEPTNLVLDIQGNIAKFKSQTETLKEFAAFTPAQVLSVQVVGEVPNQNIHGAPQPEMVIVAHPNFLSYAQELADIHADHDGLRSLVVTTDQVYNEFSSGAPDVSAIRNMMRMFYNRSTSEQDMPKYLLLFGDGSYDNINLRTGNTNFIPTFQSENSVNKQFSFVTDDFFGLLDYNEGEADGLLDIGVGRIPSSTTEEANVAVQKIRSYLSPSSLGSWHNQLCFIADDEDGNLHINQANQLTQLVENSFPRYNIEKIFFDAFPQVSTTQGNRYPDVNKAINNRANQGALIMNYTGHANAVWLSDEKVLMIADIQSWRNFDRLPLFVTATCEFSRFDDFGRKSAGEHVLFSPRGGGVGLISTTRIVYASSNHILNMNFYRNVFKEKPYTAIKNHYENRYYSLGEVLRLTKINSGSGYNKRSFMLLGDPALALHYPSFDLQVTAINSIPIGSELDTLKALSKVTVSGSVIGLSKDQPYDGEAEIKLYDKQKEITTLANDGGIPYTFKTRENVIYRGRSTMQNGEFETTFIIPKDIMYSFGSGRFSLFATNNDVTGSGYFEDFTVGGISDNLGSDKLGPHIDIYLNDKNFVSGGITDRNPKLIAFLTDSSGINTTGTGIGHDLVATLIGEDESTFVLNDYYVAEIDSYQSGKVEYQFSDLNPGRYRLKIKAWDVYNNSSESEIEFTVKADNKLELKHVLNYPNPFTERTNFFFEHNQPYENFDVLIQVVSPSGKLVKTIEYFYPGSGSYRVGPIPWDGLDDFGDRIGRGVYFYRLKVRLSNGKTVEKYEKLVILK